MLSTPPKEAPWFSWMALAMWTVAILVTVPFARAVRNLVSERWGRDAFLYLTLLVLSVSLALALKAVRNTPRRPLRNTLWLLGVALIFAGYTIHLREAPEEALHFVQYGVLGILAFRAWSHSIRDPSIYLAGSMIGLFVGLLDEAIQWITPQRYWGLGDVWLDFLGATLVQVGIAKGIQPPFIVGRPKPESIRWLCRLSIGVTLLVAATVLNTPERINWYSSRWSGLEFLRSNESVMFEYGHLYQDPDTGPFRSRFAPEELKENDDSRAQETAQILDSFQGDAGYSEFLETYTPVTDPWVHEARVHLFRRDRNLENAGREGITEKERKVHLTVAYRENRIMEKYFPRTLRLSSYVLPPEVLKEMSDNLVREAELPAKEVESGVSKHLVTSVNELQILTAAVLSIAFLVFVDWRFGGRQGRNEPR